jgi:hypothetical protein
LSGLGLDDFDRDTCCGGNLVAGVAGIGEDEFDEGKRFARGLEDRTCAIAVLNAGIMRSENEPAPVGIDQCMTLAALDLLAGIVASWAAAFSGFDALTIAAEGEASRPTRSRSAITSS